MARRTTRFATDAAPSNALLDNEIFHLNEKLEAHAKMSKDYAERAAKERAETNDMLKDILKGMSADRETNREKHEATNKRIDAWENKGHGAKWAIGVAITALTTIGGAIGATVATILKYGGLPK